MGWMDSDPPGSENQRVAARFSEESLLRARRFFTAHGKEGVLELWGVLGEMDWLSLDLEVAEVGNYALVLLCAVKGHPLNTLTLEDVVFEHLYRLVFSRPGYTPKNPDAVRGDL